MEGKIEMKNKSRISGRKSNIRYKIDVEVNGSIFYI